MSFVRANIDRAIVMTQYDLRGFAHPLGMRMDYGRAKYLDAATGNFIGFAAGRTGGSKGTDEPYVDYFESSYEDYLAMCKRLAANCDLSQQEAIQLLVKDIIQQHVDITTAVEAGTKERSNYLMPLSKDNRWGKAVLALQEAFEPEPRKAAA